MAAGTPQVSAAPRGGSVAGGARLASGERASLSPGWPPKGGGGSLLHPPSGKPQLPAPPEAPGKGAVGRGAGLPAVSFAAPRGRWERVFGAGGIPSERPSSPQGSGLRAKLVPAEEMPSLGAEGVWEARRLLGLAPGSRGRAASLRAGKKHFVPGRSGGDALPCSLGAFQPSAAREGMDGEAGTKSARCRPTGLSPARSLAGSLLPTLPSSGWARGLAPDGLAVAFFSQPFPWLFSRKE